MIRINIRRGLMREKLDNKIPNTDSKQKRIKLEIDKPRGYTLKTIDVNINDFIVLNNRIRPYV